MSELNHYSFSARMGNAANEIVKIISKSCAALNCPKLKNVYLATAEREMRLKGFYDKNFAKFHESHPINAGSKPLAKTHVTDINQNSRIRAIHTVSMFESLSQVKSMALVAKTRHRDRWDKISSAVSALKRQLKAPEFDPVKIEQLVDKSELLTREMSFDTHGFLAKAEDELMIKKIAESVSALQYNVRTDGLSLIASKKFESIRAKAGAGILALDATSFSGISCHAQIQIIEKDLKQRGLVLRRLCEHSMSLPKGGVRLNDPFPACPTDKQNNLLNRKSIAAVPEKNQDSRAPSKPQNWLIHQNLQQMDSSRIKEKTT